MEGMNGYTQQGMAPDGVSNERVCDDVYLHDSLAVLGEVDASRRPLQISTSSVLARDQFCLVPKLRSLTVVKLLTTHLGVGWV